MENQNATVKPMAPTPSSSAGMEKKAWRRPQLTRLGLKDTKGGGPCGSEKSHWGGDNGHHS